MTAQGWVPLAVVASSLLPGLVIFLLPEDRRGLRAMLNLAGAFAKLGLVGLMLWNVGRFHEYEARMTVLPGLDLVLRADELSLLFMTLSALLWLLTTVYAIGYLEDSPHRSRFFGFFSLCVSATAGIALAGNLFTLFVFYEILTLVTYPLVIHRGTPAALAAGRTYLFYTVPAGALLLLAVAASQVLTGPQDFVGGGYLKAFGADHATALVLLFAALVTGFGVKAALVPLHGWLPLAMVAPAPVSALLHAVAVVKAGAFAIVRVVYEMFGVEFAATLGVLTPLAVVAAVTIVYGSLRALMQDELKKRLAYSTVSQVSYIVLGTALLGPVATTGALVHLVHQGLMKITLFFSAGNYAETLGVHHVSEMDGIGRRMPWTTTAFTVGALGMIGGRRRGAGGPMVGDRGARRLEPAQCDVLPAGVAPRLVPPPERPLAARGRSRPRRQADAAGAGAADGAVLGGRGRAGGDAVEPARLGVSDHSPGVRRWLTRWRLTPSSLRPAVR